jgi:AcrR family transcriptional regulator
MSARDRKPAAASKQAPPTTRIGERRREALADGSNDEYKAKRAELVRVAADVFNELGYEAATLHDIAERFGRERASLYYYVSGKEELLQAVVERFFDLNLAEAERIRVLDSDARTKIRLLIRQLVDSYVQSYPASYVYIENDMTRIALIDSPWALRMQRQTKHFEQITLGLFQQGVDEGVFRRDLPVVLSTNALFGMLNWTHRWFKPTGKWKAEELVEVFSTILFTGIETPG